MVDTMHPYEFIKTIAECVGEYDFKPYKYKGTYLILGNRRIRTYTEKEFSRRVRYIEFIKDNMDVVKTIEVGKRSEWKRINKKILKFLKI